MKNSLLHLTMFSFLINMLLSVPMEIDKELESKTSSGDLIKSKSYVTADLTKVGQDVMTLRTCIGAPAQCLNLVYDTASFHMWVPANNSTGCIDCKPFHMHLSRTYEDNSDDGDLYIKYLTGDAVGKTGTDNIRIGTLFKNISMNFLIANNIAFNAKGADGIIGFGRNYNTNSNKKVSTKNSIVAVMKENGLINRSVFSQKFVNSEKTRAKLFIGDVHPDFIDHHENVTSCTVFTSDPFFAKTNVGDLWTCRLSHIIFGDNDVPSFQRNSHSIYSKAVFDTGSNYILAPKESLISFRAYFFYYPECGLDVDTIRGITLFYCDLDFDVSILPKISFVINGTAYHVPAEDLFKDYSAVGFEKQVFNIFFLNNIDYWSLGQIFLNNFHVLFDHDKNSVSFFPLDSKYVSDVSSKTTDKDFVFSDYHALAFVLLLVLILATTSALIVYYLRKRRVNSASVNNNGISYQLMEKSIKISSNI